MEVEDYSVQPIVEVSPPKWHLGHTTWFWEQFLLNHFDRDYQVFDPDFAYFFNSYYNHVGTRVIRSDRGLMTRPTVSKIIDYRHFVTEKVLKFLGRNASPEIDEIVELGINHEEQHQDLLVYDIKYILGNQPGFPNPDFTKAEGAIGEYNGKFMVNQMVLRGASVATPRDHSRKTYRNFFHPHLRWMFSGIRLAK